MTVRSMGQPNVPVLTVEDGATILRGLAVPFDEPAVVAGPQGSVVLEIMDRESIGSVAADLPLLVSHNRDVPPAGIIRHTAVMERGLGLEAEMIGSDPELEGWRRRFREGLMAALSIGFARSRKKDVYERPARAGGLPIVRPRDIEVIECSLVMWGAYRSAGVTSLSLRSADGDLQHERSLDHIAWAADRRKA